MAMVNIEAVEVWGFNAGTLGLVGVTMDLWHQITSEVIKKSHSEPQKIPFLVNFGGEMWSFRDGDGQR